MSGIAGLICPHGCGERTHRAVVERMCDLQAHRGPEGRRVFEERGACLGETVWRLSAEPEGAPAPFEGKLGNLRIVFDGFISNRATVREALERDGERPASDADAELVLRAFARWRKGCFDRLAGMYALALHDGEAGTTTLARDPYGVKPLHYAVGEGHLAFASEMRPLFSAVPHRGPNKRAVMEWLLYGDVLPPETLFEGISTLPPGHLLEVDPGGGEPRLLRYYDLPAHVDAAVHESYLQMSPSRLADELDEMIQQSIAECMPEGRAGVFFSGGIDSALVAAVAMRKGEVVALSGSVGDAPESDERPAAERAARDLSLPIVYATARREDFLRELAEVVFRIETPAWHTQFIAYHLLAEKAREEGVRVLLCGSTIGAMLGVAGGRHAAQKWLRPAEKVFGLLPWKALRAVEKTVLALRKAPVTAPGFLVGLVPAAQLADGYARDSLIARYEDAYSFIRDSAERGIQAARLADTSLLRPRFFHRADRLGMAVSAEHRDPMQSPPFVHRLINYPLGYLLHGGTNKWVLKKVAARYLPHRVVHRKKVAWALPEERYLSSLARPTLFLKGFCAEFFRLDPDAIRDFAELWHRNPASFFHLVGIEVWGRLFHKGETVSQVENRLIRTE
ncbi:MAG: asparagine synthase-related protein [Candidatus Eisenbacteria bacterium]